MEVWRNGYRSGLLNRPTLKQGCQGSTPCASAHKGEDRGV